MTRRRRRTRRPHPFAEWMLSDNNALFSSFARHYGDVLPSTGSRETLRVALAAEIAKNGPRAGHLGWDPLDLFDVAWTVYRPACTAPRCSNKVVLGSDLCTEHELEALL